MYDRITKYHTKVYQDGNDTVVRFWNTDVVRFSDARVVLDTGGYFTPTTKLRMNQASDVYALGYYVYQRQGVFILNRYDVHGMVVWSGIFEGNRMEFMR